MHIEIVYDSKYGNTEHIAQILADHVTKMDTVRLTTVDASDMSSVQRADVLLLGTPTHGGMPTENMQAYLKKCTEAGKKPLCAVFDTRIAENDVGLALKIIMKAIGYAAPKMYASLQKIGMRLVVGPEGFFVEGREGPLKKGESDRAARWMDAIMLMVHS
jgi:flavodoxin